ncbi:hypothetical protein [Aeropyrum pernix]|nr:hypothetical protein [Aeropyrum pernix]
MSTSCSTDLYSASTCSLERAFLPVFENLLPPPPVDSFDLLLGRA